MKNDFRDELIIDGETLVTSWWKSLKYVRDCTIYISLSNFYYAIDILHEAIITSSKDTNVLKEYTTEMEMLIRAIGNENTLKMVSKFSKDRNNYSDFIVVNPAQNLKICIFKGIHLQSSENILDIIEETVAFALLKQFNNKSILLLTEMDELIDFITKTNCPIEHMSLK